MTTEINLDQVRSGPPCKNCGGDPLTDHYCGGPCGGFGAVLDEAKRSQEYEDAKRLWHGVHGIGPCRKCLDDDGHLRKVYREKPITYCGCESCEGHQKPQKDCGVCHNTRAILVKEWAIPPDPAATEPTKPVKNTWYEGPSGEPAFGFMKNIIGRQVA